MSRYTVVSLPEAEDDLATNWADAVDRNEVSESANTADRLLATNPGQDAHHLSEQLWRLDVPPLRFYFAVRERDRLVEISNALRAP